MARDDKNSCEGHAEKDLGKKPMGKDLKKDMKATRKPARKSSRK